MRPEPNHWKTCQVQSTAELFSPSLHSSSFLPGQMLQLQTRLATALGQSRNPKPTPLKPVRRFPNPGKGSHSALGFTMLVLKHGPTIPQVTSPALLLNTSPAGTSVKTEAKAQDMGNPSDTQENTAVRRRQIRDQPPHKRNKHLQQQHRSSDPMFTLVAPFIPVP